MGATEIIWSSCSGVNFKTKRCGTVTGQTVTSFLLLGGFCVIRGAQCGDSRRGLPCGRDITSVSYLEILSAAMVAGGG